MEGGGGGGRGKPRIAQSLLSSGTMEWIDSGKTSDEGFSLIGNRVPAQTLEYDSGISDLLGEGSGVVGTERRVAAEENVGDDGCVETCVLTNTCRRVFCGQCF